MPDACTVRCSKKRVLVLTRVHYANTPEKLLRGELQHGASGRCHDGFFARQQTQTKLTTEHHKNIIIRTG